MIKPILVYLAASASFLIGFFCCAILAARKISKLEAVHHSADAVVKEAIRVIGYLGLWGDHEFNELSELIDKYEEQ